MHILLVAVLDVATYVALMTSAVQVTTTRSSGQQLGEQYALPTCLLSKEEAVRVCHEQIC